MKKSKDWGIKIAPWVLLAPNLIIFAVFIVWPAIMGFTYSFYKWDGLGEKVFIGFNNYIKAFGSAEFWGVFGRTAAYALVSVPLIMAAALLLANLLVKDIKLKGFFRASFYWPKMISFIIVGLSFRFLFGDSFGVINYILEVLGFKSVAWLTDSFFAQLVVILATVWSMAGYYMVMFISGLQSIPESYYEASQVDGATSAQRFFLITLPLLKPTTFLVLILSIIDVFKAYPLIKALTGGGPASSTKMIVQYIYEEGFTKSNLGYASALSMILLVVLAIFTGIQFKINRGGEI